MAKGEKCGAIKLKTVSMTGFGRAASEQPSLSLECEVKSVNSRFLDLAFRLPRAYNRFENELRELVTKHLSRGRVEIFVKREPKSSEAVSVGISSAALDSLFQQGVGELERLSLCDDAAKQQLALSLLVHREVIEVGDDRIDVTKEKEVLFSAMSEALESLTKLRTVEGQKLGEDLQGRLATVESIVENLSTIVKDSPARLKDKLDERIAQLASTELDAVRLATEVALLADRVDVTEELVRLKSHFQQFKVALETAPNGRTMEFLLQEIGREFNTIGSKTAEAEVQSQVVKAKSELEKMREQAANLE